jgi:hypothetical protein
MRNILRTAVQFGRCQMDLMQIGCEVFLRIWYWALAIPSVLNLKNVLLHGQKTILQLYLYIRVYPQWITGNNDDNSSMPLVRERTVPAEKTPFVGEVSANFLLIEGVVWSARWIPMAVF